MFSNPVFLQLAIDFFYASDGIAVTEPLHFERKLPLPALAIVRYMVSLPTLLLYL